MIILDWDKIGDKNMNERLILLLTYDFIKSIEVRLSPSLDGYHIYIETWNYLNPNFIYRFRMEHHDDLRRLAKDMLIRKTEIRNIAFTCKIKSGHRFNEVKMFKYVRTNSNKWLKVPLSQNSESRKLQPQLQ